MTIQSILTAMGTDPDFTKGDLIKLIQTVHENNAGNDIVPNAVIDTWNKVKENDFNIINNEGVSSE